MGGGFDGMKEINSGKAVKTVKALAEYHKVTEKLIEHYRRIAELAECLLELKNNDK